MTANETTGCAGKNPAESTDMTDEEMPDIRPKRDTPDPIRGRGFAHLQLAHSSVEIESDDEISPGEIEIFESPDEKLHVAFEFDKSDADYPNAMSSMGFQLTAEQADRLAVWLNAYAHYTRTGEWNDPEEPEPEEEQL